MTAIAYGAKLFTGRRYIEWPCIARQKAHGIIIFVELRTRPLVNAVLAARRASYARGRTCWALLNGSVRPAVRLPGYFLRSVNSFRFSRKSERT